jgi:hypothetical protein
LPPYFFGANSSELTAMKGRGEFQRTRYVLTGRASFLRWLARIAEARLFADLSSSACYSEGSLVPSKGLFGVKDLQDPTPPMAVEAFFADQITCNTHKFNKIDFNSVYFLVT